MTAWTIVVPGQPVAKGRPRFAPSTGRAYTPERTVRYESLVALVARGVLDRIHEDAVVEVEILAVFERPKRLLRARDPDGLVPHITKIDLDNVCKAGIDGLSAHLRDQQVQRLSASKWYAERGGQPRTEITVRIVPHADAGPARKETT